MAKVFALRAPIRLRSCEMLGIGQPSVPLVHLLSCTKSKQNLHSLGTGLGARWTWLTSAALQGRITPSAR
jgi:hypothetical protein